MAGLNKTVSKYAPHFDEEGELIVQSITSFPQTNTSGFEVTRVGLANSQGITNNTIIPEQTARPIIYETSKSKMPQFIMMTNIINIYRSKL